MWVGRSTTRRTRISSSTLSTWQSRTANQASRDRASQSRSPVHLVGFHQQDPRFGADTLVRHDRRLLRRHDGVILVIDADRVAEPKGNGEPGSTSRTRYLLFSRSCITVNAATPNSDTQHRLSTSYASVKHPFLPNLHTPTGNQTIGHVSRGTVHPSRKG